MGTVALESEVGDANNLKREEGFRDKGRVYGLGFREEGGGV